MTVYHLQKKQFVPLSLDEAWEFFSSPHNLKKITPDKLKFHIIQAPEKMYPGAIIQYKVRPLFNIPLFWMTEITHVEPKSYFIDEQRVGPYKLWHHEHHFKEVNGGVEMEDILYYKLPFGFIGSLLHTCFIKSQVEGIFNYRSEVMSKLFNKPS